MHRSVCKCTETPKLWRTNKAIPMSRTPLAGGQNYTEYHGLTVAYGLLFHAMIVHSKAKCDCTWALRFLTILNTQLFIQNLIHANNKDHTIAGSLCWESTGKLILHQTAQWWGKWVNPWHDVIMKGSSITAKTICVNPQALPRSSRYVNSMQESLCMRPANERRRYNVTSSLIGWAHA